MTTPNPQVAQPALGSAPASAPTSAPAQSYFDSITPQQESDALGNISSMLTGTQMLKDQPGVVYALQAQKAHPADAQAIDQFMQGLDAEKQVRLASATNHKITLTDAQKNQLDLLGVSYTGVLYTQQDAMNDTATKVAAQSGGTQQVKKNADGTFALDANGNMQVQSVPGSGYKAKGIGRLFQSLHNDILKPVMRDAVMFLIPLSIEPSTVGGPTVRDHRGSSNLVNLTPTTTTGGG
jgi:hypothetical protein